MRPDVKVRYHAAWTGSDTWSPSSPPDVWFAHVGNDSRRLKDPVNTLFFCIRGKRHDGHKFIEESYRSGVRHFVTERKVDGHFPNAYFLVVENVSLAFQKLAGQYRSLSGIPLTAITGSNGKTTVKEWLFHLYRSHTNPFRSPKSYNSQIGVPLSLTMMENRHSRGFIEAGISLPGEMEYLEAMIFPDTGILTSFGSAHDEGFADREQKLLEKLMLFRRCSRVIAPARVVSTYPEAFLHLQDRLLTWSDDGLQADVMATATEIGGEAQQIQYTWGGVPGDFTLPFEGKPALENSLTCLLYALSDGLDPAYIHDRLHTLPSVVMRLEVREGWHDNMIINDQYNADPDSLDFALQFFQQHSSNRQGWLILSDLLETGISDEQISYRVAIMLSQYTWNKLTWIGKLGRYIQSHCRHLGTISIYPDTEAFIADLEQHQCRNTTILIKGARKFRLEKVSSRLIKLTHQTVVEVNTAALSHNLQSWSAITQPETRFMVMVKASAYGGGGTAIARWLAHQRVHYLGVAYADEGVELRKAGVETPIMVLNADEASFPAILNYRLEPEIHSQKQLLQLLAYLGPSEDNLSIHIKLETGMHRLGFEANELKLLADTLIQSPNLRVRSILSHLASSDDPEHDNLTHHQAEQFVNGANFLSQEFGYKPIFHLVNTSGIRRFPQYHFDMVRLGIGLYGYESSKHDAADLRPAVAMYSTISRIHLVPAGEGIGYGFSAKANHDRQIATIAAGYADGILRLAGDGRFQVMIHGQRATTVGRICMDMFMVDVSAIPEAKPGDRVTIFDQNWPISHLCEALQTIPYEVLSIIPQRVPRVYIED